MKITVMWQLVPRSKHDQRAVTLAGIIGQEVGIPLLAGAMVGYCNWEGFTLEVPSLGYRILRAGSISTYELQVCSILTMIENELRKYDIVPRIRVNDSSLLQYATQQESLAQARRATMIQAIAMLKATRGWFKDHRLADIRRKLEEPAL